MEGEGDRRMKNVKGGLKLKSIPGKILISISKSNIKKGSIGKTIGKQSSSATFETARFGNKMNKNENNSTHSQFDMIRLSNGLESCDWPAGIANHILSTNRKPELLKRKRETDLDYCSALFVFLNVYCYLLKSVNENLIAPDIFNATNI